jgi:hypothetical protein
MCSEFFNPTLRKVWQLLALVDAIPIGCGALAVILAGAVCRHEDVAGGQGDHVVAGIVGEHSDLKDASRDHGRTD